MAGEAVGVQVKGMAKLRKDLRSLDKDALKEVQAGTKVAARIVAAAAGPLAPRQTGTLAGGYRGTTSGNKGVVYSQVPYAGVFEWGGTIHPRGAEIRIRAANPVGRAIEASTDRIVDAIGDGIERAAAHNGFH